MRSWVKVERGGERFWCKVQSEDNGVLTVVVDNDLVGSHGIRRGDRLAVQYAHILEVADVSDMRDFLRCAIEHGSSVDGALAWRQQRIGADKSVESNGPLLVGSVRVR